MILTDGTHLVSTASLEELHTFAAGIGLRRRWFQNHHNPHYDLFGQAMLQRALRAGARMMSSRRLICCVRSNPLSRPKQIAVWE